MAVRFFGQFLLENGVITAEQLLAAIAYQDRMNLKFGDTAIQLSLLDKARLEQIFALQRKEDIKTGEAGVKLGFLTATQVDQVLRAQKNSHVMIGEALVKTSALTDTKLSEQLAEFKKDQDVYQLYSGLPRQKDATGLAAPAIDLTLKLLLRLANLRVKLVDVRYSIVNTLDPTWYTIRLPFSGDYNGEIALRSSGRVCAQIASAMLGERVPLDDTPVIIDAVSEFLNVVGGNLAAVTARQGKKVELSTPRPGEILAEGRDAVVARIGTPDGDIECIVTTAST